MNNIERIEKIKSLSKPFPKFIEEILSLYEVKVPFFFVSQGIVEQFTDDDAVGTLVREPPSIGEPQCVLLSYDVLHESEEKNKNLILLKEVLHEIGHLKLLKETDKFKKETVLEFSKLDPASLFGIVRLGMENRVDNWVKKEWRKIRPFTNTKIDGWKKGVRLKDVEYTLHL